MKKIMIAASIVVFTAVAQATTYNWEIDVYANKSGETPIGINAYAYFFDGANGDFTAAQMINLLTTDSDWATSFGNATKIGQADVPASWDGEIAAEGTIDTIEGKSGADGKGVVNAFMVLFDSSTLATAEKFTLVDFGGDHDVTSAEGTANLVHFTTSDTLVVGDPAGWTSLAAVPEPTSGLLLLLGVAGLALRRRRA